MDTLLWYLIIVFLSIVFINCAYYLFFLKFTIPKSSKPNISVVDFGVSIVICSKNEANNLRENVTHWLAQNYANFEIVLIDDASIDDTSEVIKAYAKKDNRITPVYVENNEAFWGSKKYALTLGIKKAKYNHLILSDADCIPKSKDYVAIVASQFTKNKQIVIGYGSYQYVKRSFLNALIRYETVLAALQYFGYAALGNPYMGVGRNLAYTKDLFYENRGFMDHMQVHSGDDDLFVNQAATSQNTAICAIESTHTQSKPKTNWKSWITQKRRHITTATHYKTKDRFLLGLFYFTQLSTFLVAILLLALSYKWQLVLGALAIRYLILGLVLNSANKHFKERSLLLLFPVLEFILVCLQLTIFSANLISKPTRWK